MSIEKEVPENILLVDPFVDDVERDEAQQRLGFLIVNAPPAIGEIAKVCLDELLQLAGDDPIVDRDEFCQKIGSRLLHQLAFAYDDAVAFQRNTPTKATPPSSYKAMCAAEALYCYRDSAVHDADAASAAIGGFTGTSCPNACLHTQLVDLISGLHHLASAKKTETQRGDITCFMKSLETLAQREKLDWDLIVVTAGARFDGDVAREKKNC